MDTSTPRFPASPEIPDFGWAEWLVFSSVLAVSVGIGIFFGCFGKKNQTNEEYLLGGRKMNPVPVALSLLCR
jgi:sodium-coupled monocarboxylate transporter 8/12